MSVKVNLGEVAYILRALNWYEDKLLNIDDGYLDEEETEIVQHIREKLSSTLKDETYL